MTSPSGPDKQIEVKTMTDEAKEDKSSPIAHAESSGPIILSKAQKRLESLRSQVEETERKSRQVESQLQEAQAKLGDADANAIVQKHIKLLHHYNEIKDIGLGLFGMIADRRGVRVKDIYEEFGIAEED